MSERRCEKCGYRSCLCGARRSREPQEGAADGPSPQSTGADIPAAPSCDSPELSTYVECCHAAKEELRAKLAEAEKRVAIRNHELHQQSLRTDEQYRRAEAAETRVRELTVQVVKMGADR